MLFQRLFFVLFSDEKRTGFLLLVGNVLNKVCYVTFEVFTDTVKVTDIETFSNFVVDVIDCRGSYTGLTCKLRLSHTFFAEYP